MDDPLQGFRQHNLLNRYDTDSDTRDGDDTYLSSDDDSSTFVVSKLLPSVDGWCQCNNTKDCGAVG